MYVDKEMRDPNNHRISAKKKQKMGLYRKTRNHGVVGEEVSSDHNPGGTTSKRLNEVDANHMPGK
jgi:hypothetical protein